MDLPEEASIIAKAAYGEVKGCHIPSNSKGAPSAHRSLTSIRLQQLLRTSIAIVAVQL